MEKVDFNIEYAHIYSNEIFGQEHQDSLAVLKLVLEIMESGGHSYNLNLLIDEYHPEAKDLDINDFIAKLKEQGFAPDYLYLESELHNDVNLLLDVLTEEKYLNDYNKYFKKNGKSPCSYLIANWYLKRLGCLPINNLQKIPAGSKPFCGRKIINILSEKYKNNEAKAIELLKHSQYRDCVDDIIYYFY